MFDYVYLAKGGLLGVRYDADQKKMVESPVEDVFTALRETLEVAPDVTVRDLIRFVAADKALCGFLAPYTHCNGLDEYNALGLAAPDDEAGLDYAEVYWYTQHFRTKSEDTLSISPGFHAIRVDKDGLKIPCGVGFSGFESIAHLPLKLDTEIVIHEEDSSKDLSSNRSFTLLDVLDVVYWEIGYYGSPAQARRFAESLDADEGEICDDDGCDLGLPVAGDGGDPGTAPGTDVPTSTPE